MEEYTYYKNNLVKSVTNRLPDGTVYDRFTYIYDDAGNLKEKTEIVGGVMRGTTAYTYDANGNRLKETKTEYGSNGKVTGTKTVLTNTYDLRNQLIRSVTEDAVINNTYNASGYRVAKAVTKSGKTTKIYFLYDGGSVIMESDENGTVTARNTYGGPLLFRTVFDGNGSEETYRYLYNAHGDVVTLLSNGAVAATYYMIPLVTFSTGQATWTTPSCTPVTSTMRKRACTTSMRECTTR